MSITTDQAIATIRGGVTDMQIDDTRELLVDVMAFLRSRAPAENWTGEDKDQALALASRVASQLWPREPAQTAVPTQIDDQMIEAVARALFDSDDTGYPANNVPWEDQPRSVRARYTARARAVLSVAPASLSSATKIDDAAIEAALKKSPKFWRETADAERHVRSMLEAALTTLPSPAGAEAVATVLSFTRGSYHRNYKIDWHKPVEAGTQLYAAPPAAEAMVKPLEQEALTNDLLKAVKDLVNVARREPITHQGSAPVERKDADVAHADDWDAALGAADAVIAKADARVRSALVAPASLPDGWRTIDSAPRDGTAIDLLCEDGRWTDCYWGKPDHCCGEYGQYCDSEWHGASEWWVWSTMNEFLPSEDPTHWMPLPAAPANAKGE